MLCCRYIIPQIFSLFEIRCDHVKAEKDEKPHQLVVYISLHIPSNQINFKVNAKTTQHQVLDLICKMPHAPIP